MIFGYITHTGTNGKIKLNFIIVNTKVHVLQLVL